MRRLNRLGEQGSAIAETALASALMLGVVLGLFEMFLAFYSYHYVSYAARDAARYAIVRGSYCNSDSNNLMPNCDVTSGELQTYVRGLGFPGINASNVTVSASWLSAVHTETSTSITTSWSSCGNAPTNCDDPGNAVQVTVVYPLAVPLPFFNKLSLNLTSRSQMVISQ